MPICFFMPKATDEHCVFCYSREILKTKEAANQVFCVEPEAVAWSCSIKSVQDFAKLPGKHPCTSLFFYLYISVYKYAYMSIRNI